MITNKNMAIIGSGNIANFLAEEFFKRQFKIVRIISRNDITGMNLAKRVEAEFSHAYDLHQNLDLVLICVSDNQIETCVSKLMDTDALVCHTAGSIGMDVMKKFKRHGVLYPLQSISANVNAINATGMEVPFLIESNSEDGLKMLKDILDLLEFKYTAVNSDNRLKYHLAAVFANNFTNAMVLATQEISENGHLDFSLLKPLLFKTLEKLKVVSPLESQTGPAKRNDLITIRKHLELLKDDLELTEVYKAISEYISMRFKK